MSIYQKIKFMNKLIVELRDVVKALGTDINTDDLKEMLEIKNNYMRDEKALQTIINKLSFQKDFDSYEGLAKQIVIEYALKVVH